MREFEAVRSELSELKQMVQQLLRQSGERPRNYEYAEAARLIGVHPKTISKMVRTGQIFPVTIPTGRGPGKRMIPLEEIDRICTPPKMKSSGATEERTRFDGAKALAELKALRKKR